MLNRIFPKHADNQFSGHKIALWLFAPIVFMKVAVSCLHMFSADGGAQISTIPIESYTTGAAQNVIALFARMGLEQFMFGLVLLLVFVRYRSLTPLMYLLIILHDIILRGLSYTKPLALTGESGAATPALVLLGLSVVGLIVSLMGKGYEERESER